MRKLQIILAGLAMALAPQAAQADVRDGNPNWIQDFNHGCWFYNTYREPNITISWTGGCDANGYADGYGEATWFKYQNWVQVDAGMMAHGRVDGMWKTRYANGNYLVSYWSNGSRLPDPAAPQYSQPNPRTTPQSPGPTLGDRAMETLERQRRENCAAVAEGRLRAGCPN